MKLIDFSTVDIVVTSNASHHRQTFESLDWFRPGTPVVTRLSRAQSWGRVLFGELPSKPPGLHAAWMNRRKWRIRVHEPFDCAVVTEAISGTIPEPLGFEVMDCIYTTIGIAPVVEYARSVTDAAVEALGMPKDEAVLHPVCDLIEALHVVGRESLLRSAKFQLIRDLRLRGMRAQPSEDRETLTVDHGGGESPHSIQLPPAASPELP